MIQLIMRTHVGLLLLCSIWTAVDPVQASLSGTNEEPLCCIPDEWEATLYVDFGTVFIDQVRGIIVP